MHVLAQLQVGVEARFERSEPQLLETPDLRLSKRLVGNLRERRPAPQRERLSQRGTSGRGIAARERLPPVLDTTLEHVRVELPRGDREQVTVADRSQGGWRSRVRAKCLAQAGNGDLQPFHRARRAFVAPQHVDQHIGRGRTIRAHQEQSQKRRLARSTRSEPPVTVAQLDGSQDRVPNHAPSSLLLRFRQVNGRPRLQANAPPYGRMLATLVARLRLGAGDRDDRSRHERRDP